MTTLELLQNTPDLETLRGLFIVLTPAHKAEIDSIQDEASTMRVSAVPLTDGRFAICADLLSEIQPGGIFHAAFSVLPLTTVNETEVLTKAEFEALRPPPEE